MYQVWKKAEQERDEEVCYVIGIEGLGLSNENFQSSIDDLMKLFVNSKEGFVKQYQRLMDYFVGL